MQHATVLVGPSGTLSLRRLKLTAQARGFENVVTINVDLSNAVVAQEADLESCETLAAILSSDPSLVGFSCFYWNVLYFLKLASAVKALRPSTLIVFGGPEATGDHERLLQRQPFIDAIVMGEGEESFCDLLTHLQHSHGKEIPSWLPSVHGIAYRNGSGRITQTPPSRVVALDDLPSPVLGEDRLVTKGVLLWELARGCPFRCTYCFESRMHHAQRFLSLPLAERELRAICADGRVKLIRCMIPTFNLDEDYALALLDLIERYNERGIRFQFELKPDLQRPTLQRKLRSMDNIQLCFGLQSTSRATALRIKRPLDPLAAERTIRELSSQWINKAVVNLICFLPGEGVSDFFDSVDQTIAWMPHTIMCFSLRVLPGTELWSQSKSLGLFHSETPPYAVFGSERLTQDDVVLLRRVVAVVEAVGQNMALIALLANLAKDYGIRPSSIFRDVVAELGKGGASVLSRREERVSDESVSARVTDVATKATSLAIASCLERVGGLDPQQSGRLLEVVRFCEDAAPMRRLRATPDDEASCLDPTGTIPGQNLPEGLMALTGTISAYGASLYRWISDSTTSLRELLNEPGETSFFMGRDLGVALGSRLAEWLGLFAEDTTFGDAMAKSAQQAATDQACLRRWTHWALANGLLTERRPTPGGHLFWDRGLIPSDNLTINAVGPDSFLVEDSQENQAYLDLNSNALAVLSFFSGGKTPRQVFEAVGEQMGMSEADFVESLEQFIGSNVLVASGSGTG
jgi:hypothetical protein